MKQSSLHVLCVFILVCASLAAAGEPFLKHVQTIPLDGVAGRLDHFGVDVESKRLYVAALGNDTLEVVDLAVGRRVQSVAGLKKPTGIRVLPESRKVVVASGEDGKVRVYSPELKLLGTVDGLDDADNVRLDPAGKLAYVGYGDGALAIIDPREPKKLGEIKLDGHPEAFQVESKGSRIFVNVPSAKHVAVVDRDRRATVAKWPLHGAESNFPMALDEEHHRLFVGCRKPAKVLVLDTTTGKEIASFDCCGDADDLFDDAAAHRLYVSGGEGCITVAEQIDGDRYRVAARVPTASGARTSMFVPELRMLYVGIPRRESQEAAIAVLAVPD
jgi:DNA-binding beta-propeller fold protein YncE